MRKIILFLCLLAGLFPAFAAVPPPVPALPDTERRTSYSITGTTCACAVNFAIYGDSTDVDEWVEVWISGTRYLSSDPIFGWVLSSPTGSLSTIPRPITDAIITFNNSQTGTVQIVGARRPRRTTQFNENQGVAARDLNQALTDIIAQNRESWDKINDATGRGIFSQPGNTVGPLPLPSVCSSAFLAFDSTGLNPVCIPGVSSSNIGPNTITNAMLAKAPADTVKCNQTASLANVSDCTVGGTGGLFDNICSSTIGQAWVRLTGGWGCAALGYFNPVWWGADPTGSSDSTSAINSAITAASATAGIVQFPAGTFKVSSQITISTQSLQLLGSGRVSTIIKTTQTAANVFNVTASYVTIQHMAIVGTSGQVDTAGAAIIVNGNISGGNFSDLYISDLFEGIQLIGGATGFRLEFVKVLNIYGAGAFVFSGGGGHYVGNGQLDPLAYATTAYSVTSGYGAWISNHAYVAGSVVIVNGGIFVCQTGGTSLSTGSGPVISPFNTLISDGTVQWYFVGASNSAAIGISNTSNSSFINNTDLSGPWSIAISISGSDNNIIHHATIGQTIGTGINLGTNATNTSIDGTLFTGMLYTNGIGVSDSGTANGTKIVNSRFNGAGWYCIIVQGSTGWVIADNVITGCGNITGAPAINITSSSLKVNVHDNVIISSTGMTNGISIGASASDYLDIHDNNVQTSSISNSATGTHNIIANNPGYNPVGLTAGTSTGTSASTITAGPSPETHYITQSATFNAAVKSGSTTLCTVATATVPCVLDLGPNESYSVTWTTTQPTYSKFVH